MKAGEAGVGLSWQRGQRSSGYPQAEPPARKGTARAHGVLRAGKGTRVSVRLGGSWAARVTVSSVSGRKLGQRCPALVAQ